MALFATIIFALSFFGIIALFVLKAWETRRGFVLAPDMRRGADERALRLKHYLMNGRQEASKIIPLLVLLGRYVIHESALGFARAAHFAGVQAHRLADLVSHKHHFERQAPRSEFLKQVSSQITERPTVVSTSPVAPMEAVQVTGFTQVVTEPSPVDTIVVTEPATESVVQVSAIQTPTRARRAPRQKKPRIFAPSLKGSAADRIGDEY